MKNKLIALILTVISIFTLTACGSSEGKDNGKLLIVTTIFPQYDFAKHIAGDKADVVLLLTPGAESHSYEPTAADISKIQKADVFIYTGGESEVWVEKILGSYGIEDNSLKLMDFVEPLKEEDEDEYDEHIFTSLRNSERLVDTISDRLCGIDKKNAETYRKNAAEYKSSLSELDKEFTDMISTAKRKTIIIGDRYPFRYFAEDYGLDCHAAFSGCSEETEADPATISELITLIRENNVPTVFYIEFSNRRAADKLAESTGTKTALWHSCHNISSDDMKNNVSYLDLQKQNLKNLSEALN